LATLGEKMNKVDDFEYIRIQQLLKQFGLYEKVNFWIVFGTLGNQNYTRDGAYSSYTSSSISSNVTINYRESGFYFLLLNLLDILIEYRSQHVITEHYHGIISVEMSAIHIEWLDEDVADMIVATLKGNENDHG
jgi:hypothetical protein